MKILELSLITIILLKTLNSLETQQQDTMDSFMLGDLPVNLTKLNTIDPEEKNLNTTVNDMEAMLNKDREIRKNLLEPRKALPDIEEKTEKFDVNNFLLDLNKYNCVKKKKDERTNCEKMLKKEAFDVIGEYNKNSSDFFKNIKDKIYTPLGFKMANNSNLSDLLVNLNGLGKKSTIFGGRALMTNYKTLEESIKNSFDDIMGKSSDMDAFQPAISELSISVLKKFHIYWNSLRQMNQIPKSLEDTKSIIKNLLEEYEQKQKFLFEVTKIIMEKVKFAYKRFLTAKHSVDLLKKDISYEISEKILERYQTNCDQIKFSKIDTIRFLHEIANLLDLQDSFNIVSYRSGINEQQILVNYKTSIFDRIIQAFNTYSHFLKDSDVNKLKILKHFTAVLLLKMEHHNFLMFQYRSISEYVTLPQANVYSEHKTTVKVYFELRDALMVIPRHCVHFLDLRVCALYETNKVIRYISGKYLLKRSIAGWGLLDFITDVLRDMYKKSNNLVWTNWTLFKNYFYQNLFATLTNFKKAFLIKDDECIGDLEIILGESIDSFRKIQINKKTDYGLVDQFDLDLYEEFLGIKSQYNILAPIERDPEILSKIENSLYKFCSEFHDNYIKEMNDDFRKLIIQIANLIKKWKKKTLFGADEVVEITEMPVNQINRYPQIFHDFKFKKQNKDENTIESTKEVENTKEDENKKEDEDGKVPNFDKIPSHNSYMSSHTVDQDIGSDNGFFSTDNSFSAGGV